MESICLFVFVFIGRSFGQKVGGHGLKVLPSVPCVETMAAAGPPPVACAQGPSWAPLSRRHGPSAVGSMPIEPTADGRAGRRQSQPEAPFLVREFPVVPPLCASTLACPP